MISVLFMSMFIVSSSPVAASTTSHEYYMDNVTTNTDGSTTIVWSLKTDYTYSATSSSFSFTSVTLDKYVQPDIAGFGYHQDVSETHSVTTGFSWGCYCYVNYGTITVSAHYWYSTKMYIDGETYDKIIELNQITLSIVQNGNGYHYASWTDSQNGIVSHYYWNS